jgi:hypothetical protein
VPPNVTTDAVVHYLAAQQLSDGNFAGQNLMRPPLEDNDVTATAISLRALQLYAPPGRQKEVARLVSRARSWLLSRQPRGMEEQSFQLQGLSWSHADSREIAKRVASIVADQRPDGGWGQFSTLASDAYASGQALVALHQAGGISTRSTTYRNGIRFLLKTQIDDGSWLVRSRARGTQPYVDSGFPHGSDQFISAAGTAWATSALLLSLDVVTPVSGRRAVSRDILHSRRRVLVISANATSIDGRPMCQELESHTQTADDHPHVDHGTPPAALRPPASGSRPMHRRRDLRPRSRRPPLDGTRVARQRTERRHKPGRDDRERNGTATRTPGAPPTGEEPQGTP